ncbi:MAG: DUF1501 domain-containing protein [Nonlabens sp.]|nr:DUF1501 domain-containing protein [Nonlabens sp.]
MNRRNFLSLSATATAGTMILPHFLHAAGNRRLLNAGNQSLVFIQLDGGNDGLNTFIPYADPLYKMLRPNIAIDPSDVINKTKGMGFHPALTGLANIQQEGNLTVLQNVGYPEPIKSHFRSQEIWQTASKSQEYLQNGWLGRYLDIQCKDIIPTAGVNIDRVDSLALKGTHPNSITMRNLDKFKSEKDIDNLPLSGHPALDFTRVIANSAASGSEEIQKALKKAGDDITYPSTGLGSQLKWISQLIKGDLDSKIYYTSLNGFDTHNNQLGIHQRKLKELDDAVYSLYKDLKNSKLHDAVTVVIFSEFGRRVKDNTSGTDHGTAAPMFIVGGNNRGQVLGSNPDLVNLNDGDLIHQIDFRSVYASLLQDKLSFDPKLIGIAHSSYKGIF